MAGDHYSDKRLTEQGVMGKLAVRADLKFSLRARYKCR
jgi:hypothetical protein